MSAPTNHSLVTFAGGELSPGLHARVDLAKYSTGLKTARNVNILSHGGVRNRPGTHYVAAASDSTHAVRLIPFTYSTGQAYILEFGEGYIRFYTADAPVVALSTVTTWGNGAVYAVGNMVEDPVGGGIYYCKTCFTT